VLKKYRLGEESPIHVLCRRLATFRLSKTTTLGDDFPFSSLRAKNQPSRREFLTNRETCKNDAKSNASPTKNSYMTCGLLYSFIHSFIRATLQVDRIPSVGQKHFLGGLLELSSVVHAERLCRSLRDTPVGLFLCFT
jgi:hypothetical protein